jgi:hypothetical protein
MTITVEIEVFIREHREHGRLTGDAGESASNGYLLTVAGRVALRSTAGYAARCQRGPLGARAAQLTMPPRDPRNLVAAFGFLQVQPREQKLQMLHRWLDNWRGVGLIAAGRHAVGYDSVLRQHDGGRVDAGTAGESSKARRRHQPMAAR